MQNVANRSSNSSKTIRKNNLQTARKQFENGVEYLESVFAFPMCLDTGGNDCGNSCYVDVDMDVILVSTFVISLSLKKKIQLSIAICQIFFNLQMCWLAIFVEHFSCKFGGQPTFDTQSSDAYDF